MLVSEAEVEATGGMARVEALLERARPIAVHLRARLPTRSLLAAAIRLRESALAHGGWCVVNGRLDVALAACAHAVQLGRTALRVEEARAAIAASGGRLRIGASVHDREGARAAVDAGADYLVLGTIYATPSHPGLVGSGAPAIVEVTTTARATPILAIGGLRVDRVAEALGAGASGVVVGRAVWGSDDPPRAAVELKEMIERHAGSCTVELGGHSDRG